MARCGNRTRGRRGEPDRGGRGILADGGIGTRAGALKLAVVDLSKSGSLFLLLRRFSSSPTRLRGVPASYKRLLRWLWLNCIHAWTWTVGMAKGQWMLRLWLWATRSSFSARFPLVTHLLSLQRCWQDQPVTPIYAGQIRPQEHNLYDWCFFCNEEGIRRWLEGQAAIVGYCRPGEVPEHGVCYCLYVAIRPSN